MSGQAELIATAVAHQRAGRNAEAHALYRQILAETPDQLDALNNLAVLLQREGRPQEAVALYDRILTVDAANATALSNRGVLLREGGRHAEAIESLSAAVAQRPDYVDALFNLGVTYIDTGRPELAVPPLNRAAAGMPANPDIQANLARALNAIGKVDDAVRHGEWALALKDVAASARLLAVEAPLRKITPKPFDPARKARNVIAFSLWGAARTYTEGAVANAQLAAGLYPEWTCRFYVDQTVPAEIVARLRAHGAAIVTMPPRQGPHEGLFWRFFAADDPTVDRFLCRDCDSRLNTQERAAVEAWLKSDKAFHSMRDAVFHTELLLAGLWGGTGQALRGLRAACAAYYRPTDHRWVDQDFLREQVWPRIRFDLLTHDSHYRVNGALPFPADGRLSPPLHVGAGITLD